MARKKDTDAHKGELEATGNLALKHARDEEAAVLSAEQEQARRETLTMELHIMAGRIQAMGLVSKFADVGNLVWLKQVKESKAYKDVPGIGTWEKFCKIAGMSRAKVDEDLQNLAVLGESFLRHVGDLGLGYRDLRKLRQLSHDGAVVIEDDVIMIGGAEIPFTSEYKEDLQVAIEAVVVEAQSESKAKDRMLKDRDAHALKLQREIARYEAEAEERGLTPDEDAALRMLDNLHAGLTGWTLRVDPGHILLGTEPSPTVRARYLAILGEFRGIARSLFDRAEEAYGYDLTEDAWTPPPPKVQGK